MVDEKRERKIKLDRDRVSECEWVWDLVPRPTRLTDWLALCVFAVVYDITVKTCEAFGAGTDADVFIQIFGKGGQTEEYELTKSSNSFESGRYRESYQNRVAYGPVRGSSFWVVKPRPCSVLWSVFRPAPFPWEVHVIPPLSEMSRQLAINILQ